MKIYNQHPSSLRGPLVNPRQPPDLRRKIRKADSVFVQSDVGLYQASLDTVVTGASGCWSTVRYVNSEYALYDQY